MLAKLFSLKVKAPHLYVQMKLVGIYQIFRNEKLLSFPKVGCTPKLASQHLMDFNK
jgi:hypothetical protein